MFREISQSVHTKRATGRRESAQTVALWAQAERIEAAPAKCTHSAESAFGRRSNYHEILYKSQTNIKRNDEDEQEN